MRAFPKDSGGVGPRRSARTASRRIAAALVVLTLVPGIAIGQRNATHREEPAGGSFLSNPAPLTEPLVTDRPDFTESPDAVPRGHIQLEMGYTFTVDREGPERVRDHTAPELLLRVGLIDDFELRLGWEGYSWQERLFPVETRSGLTRSAEDSEEGSLDVSLGFKYKLMEQNGPVPHLGVIAALTAPSGTAGFSSGDVDPVVVVAWAYDLSDRWAVAGNVGVGAPTDDGTRFAQGLASLSVAHSLTDRWGTYVEYFGLYPNAEGSDAAHSLNGGFTYLIHDNLQFDVRAGFGLNEEADDFFAGAGLAWRL